MSFSLIKSTVKITGSSATSHHLNTIKAKLPDWLIKAPSTTHAALRGASLAPLPWLENARTSMPQVVTALQQTYAANHVYEQRIAPTLAGLSTVEAFAAPLLTAAIKEEFGLDVDVRNTYLFHARRAQVDQSFASVSKDPMVSAQNALKASIQTLLHAALQNFEAWETEPGGMDLDPRRKAAIYYSYPLQVLSIGGHKANIVPEQFAALCRTLDLGGRYQAHLKAQFHPPSEPGDSPTAAAANLRGDFKHFEQSAFRLQLHIAYMKKAINPPLYAALLELASYNSDIQLEGTPITCSFLRLWDVELTGIIVFGKDRSEADDIEKVVVYIPDDPVAPVKEYASTAVFVSELRDRMFLKGYLEFFQRLVPARHKNQLFNKIEQALRPKVWNSDPGFYEHRADPEAKLHLRETNLSGNYLSELYQQKFNALKDDALFHAVPTAVDDQKTLAERVQYFEEKAFLALNVAGFFVPVLGQVMLAVTAAQLSYEAYEGIESWTRGEQEQAWGYLMDVVENAALMLALSAAAGGAGETPVIERIPVETPSFIEELKAVELPTGETRLWKPDLAPFAHDAILPSGLQPDDFGLYHYQGKTWLTLEDRLYSVKALPGSDRYRLDHPTKAISYEPLLRHNGAGAWLHELDQPLDWDGLTLFRRLGHSTEGISDVSARRILKVSETHEAVLRHVLSEGQRPPALLDDTLQRFKLDQDIERFIEQGDNPQLQRELLVQDPAWPATETLLADDTLRTVLQRLDERQIKTLLGEEFGDGPRSLESRIDALTRKLTAAARAQRSELFDRLYQRQQGSGKLGVEVIRGPFAGRLPLAVAEELLSHASPAELEQLLDEQRLPLRIAEEAREYLQQVRLTRAYEGLYLDSVVNADTDIVILHSLERLPGWSPQVRLEVRNATLHGVLLDSVGPAQAPICRVLVKEGGQYQTFDAEGQHLHGRDTLYAAVLHALPDAQRQALGFAHVGQGLELKRALQAQALLPRQDVRPLLRMQPLKPGSKSPMRLADGRPGYPLSGRGVLPGYFTEDSLLDKIRLLELEDAFPEEILARLSNAGMTRAQIDARLNQLLEEQQQLRSSLDTWALTSASMPELGEARRVSRSRIGEALWDHWRANNLAEIGRGGAPLRLERVSLADFPDVLPDFVHERVEGLVLSDFTIDAPVPDIIARLRALNHAIGNDAADAELLGRLLDRFPQISALEVSRDRVPTWPERSLLINLPEVVVTHLPALRELSLVNQGIALDQTQMDFFRSLTHLDRLDLSGNLPSYDPPNDLSGLHLTWLGLDRLGLLQWPSWIDSLLPEHVAELSLRGNRMTGLPESLLSNPLNPSHHTLISLEGNSLSRSTVLRARLSEQGRATSFRFNMGLPAVMETILNLLLQERAALQEAIDQWTEASSSTAPLSDEMIQARRRIGDVLLAHWRDYSLGETFASLHLEAVDLVDFPRQLPDFFYNRVRHLQLSRVTSSPAQLNQFLSRFRQLSNLIMSGHSVPLSELPQALLELPMLESLGLIDQGVVFDQSAITFFARLPALRYLELDGNRLGDINHVPASLQRGLQRLSLSAMQLRDWPLWVNDLIPAPLEILNLEDNLLTALPDNILTNPRNHGAHTEINLLGNPLSQTTMLRAHMSDAYGRSYSFAMNLPDAIRDLRPEAHSSDSDFDSDMESDSNESGHRHSPAFVDAEDNSGAAPWLIGTVEENAAHQALWQRIDSAGDAQDLLRLIDRLRHTADFRTPRTRDTFVNRVWLVLAAVEQSDELRLTLNGMAEEPLRLLRDHDTCPDGIRLEFNQMELQVFTRQSLLDVPAAERGRTLYRLTQRLYRLHELDAIARERAGTRDEAEVRLAYRMRWAQELDLPLAPGSMLYEAHAAIRPGELDAALARVQVGERGEPFLLYAAQRDFWLVYLRETYAERFQQIEDAYKNSVMALEDEFPEYDAAYQQRVFALDEQRQEQEQSLIRELTNREGLDNA
ncbi:MAG: NEL-type E3 ubiquitin ligase domain-containing protein [Pseudomonas sp.]